ncbi:MAG: sulfite exporter TauE/SafE family protein [Chloroflexota bacterium]
MSIAIISILAGFVVGILIGMTGMGGGAIMTPFLILVMKIDPVLAIGTDLAFASITKWLSGIQHLRQNRINLKSVLWMALGSLPASYVTSHYIISEAGSSDELRPILTLILGGMLVLISLYTFARSMNWIKISMDENWPPVWVLTLVGMVGGGLVGLTSVGSGTIIMATLLVFYSIPAAQLVGMDVLHGAILTSIPAIVYAFGGQVDWNLAAWLLVGSIPGGWVGTRLVSIVPQRVVRGILSVVLLFAGLRLFFK